VGHGVAVEQKSRWAISAVAKVNSDFRGSRLNSCVAEVFKYFRYPYKNAVSIVQSVGFSFLKNKNNRTFNPFF